MNVRNEDGDTLLHLVVKSENCDLTALLLGKPYYVNVNARNMKDYTPLHCAIACGNYDLAVLLLKNSYVDVNARDSLGYTPLLEAIDLEHYKIACLLLKNPSVNLEAINKFGFSALSLLDNKIGHEFLKPRPNQLPTLRKLHNKLSDLQSSPRRWRIINVNSG